MNKYQTALKSLFIYLLGMNIMALGIVINTRTNLGVAAISSVPFAYSILLNMSLGLSTFILYIIFILVQCILVKKLDYKILMQIPMAFVVSLFIELYDIILPKGLAIFWVDFILLLTSNTLTGLGVYLMTKTNLILDPGNGIVETICQTLNKPFSFIRIRFDIGLVIFTCISGLLIKGSIVGVGLGTVISAYLIGKMVGVSASLLDKKMNTFLKKNE